MAVALGGPIFSITVRIDDRQARRMFNSAMFVPTFNKHMSRQLFNFGNYAVKRVRDSITGGSYASLGVQQYLKGSAKPLVHTGQLSNGFTYKFDRLGVGPVVGMTVGPKQEMHSSGISMAKLAQIQHDGTSFTPTPQQRIAVAMKALRAGAPLPEGAPKPTWNIPSRPFMARAMMRPEVIKTFIHYGTVAINRTFSELKSRGY